jgi:hypothetical protein
VPEDAGQVQCPSATLVPSWIGTSPVWIFCDAAAPLYVAMIRAAAGLDDPTQMTRAQVVEWIA